MRRLIPPTLSLLSFALFSAQSVQAQQAPPAQPEAPAAPAAPAPAEATPAAEPAAAPPAEEPVELEEETPPPAAPEPAPAQPQAPATASVGMGAEATATAGDASAQAATPPPPPRQPSPVSRGGGEVSDAEAWTLNYNGYFRAPFRVGIGKRDDPAEGQSGTTFHRPLVPDGQYFSHQHTNHSRGDWAEMFFSYGNAYARGTLAIQGFQFTDSAWTEPGTNFGIGQGWIELNSDLGFENVKMTAKVGSFWNRYGMAGRWDAGEYDTYLFGRTHGMGESVRFDINLDPNTDIWLEHGIGARRPDPNIYNRTRYTLFHHGHFGLVYGGNMEFTAHYLNAFARSGMPVGQDTAQELVPIDPATGADAQPDGSMTVLGVDARLDLAQFGYLYGGFSHVIANHAVVVGRAIEVIHASGGGEFDLGITDNYLEHPACRRNLDASCSEGNGSISTVLAQYELPLGNLVDIFSGGQDLVLKLYGMFNAISLNDAGLESEQRSRDAGALPDGMSQDGVTKLKFGTDLEFLVASWLGFGTRFDRVQPHSDIPEESFAILSPRVIFKSDWSTHEEIVLQYSRYFYNQRTCDVGNPAVDPFDAAAGYQEDNADGVPGRIFCVQPPASAVPPDGFGAHINNQYQDGDRGAPSTRPDLNVFTIEASMWW